MVGGSVTTNFGGVDVVLLLWRGEGDRQLWGSGRGASVGCHCSVLIGFCYLGSMLV